MRDGPFQLFLNMLMQNNPDQAAYARALWERIRRECQ